MQIRRSLFSLSLYKPHISPSFSLLFFSSSSRREPIAMADYLLHHHQFSPETLDKLSSSPEKTLKNPENSDSILSFFRESGFSNTCLERVVVRNPDILSANLERTIKPKMEIFRDLGLCPTDIAAIFSTNPWIFKYSMDKKIRPSILALKGVLGSAVNISRLLKISGWFVGKDLERTLIPNIEFLKSCGASSSHVLNFIYIFPRFFLTKPEQMKEFARRVDEMGSKRNTKMYLYALRTVASMSLDSWGHKWEFFRGLGFSDDEISSIFRAMPPVFLVSEMKIKEIMQILSTTEKFDNSLIISDPALLLYSVERRIKPRIQVLELLERKNLLRKKPRLSTFCKMAEKDFLRSYILPYANEVGDYCSLVEPKI